MPTGYVLSEQTAEQLRELLATDADPGTTGNTSGATRFVGFVLVGTGTLNGTVQQRNATDGVWQSFAACKVADVNDAALKVGKRYLVVRTGNDATGNPQMIAVSPPVKTIDVVTGWTCSNGSLTAVKTTIYVLDL